MYSLSCYTHTPVNLTSNEIWRFRITLPFPSFLLPSPHSAPLKKRRVLQRGVHLGVPSVICRSGLRGKPSGAGRVRLVVRGREFFFIGCVPWMGPSGVRGGKYEKR